MRLPWREEILRGILGADVVGLQRRGAAENLVLCSRRLLDAHGAVPGLTLDGRPDRGRRVPHLDRRGRVRGAGRPAPDPGPSPRGCAPASVTPTWCCSASTAWTTRRASTSAWRRSATCWPAATSTGGAARSSRSPCRPGSGIEHYADERRRVEQLVGEINGEFSRLGYPVVHYLHQNVPMEELSALYQVGDVMLVTPLRDGMNLVAKEYAASRVDGGGVLVLSEFAGAADELGDALLVNPHDREAVRRRWSTRPRWTRRRPAAAWPPSGPSCGPTTSTRWAQGFLGRLDPALAA